MIIFLQTELLLKAESMLMPFSTGHSCEQKYLNMRFGLDGCDPKSIREIAAKTGVSENLVKVRIFRAKEKLREILADLRVTF